MTSKRLTTFILAAALSAGSALALADSSTGSTDPTPKGTQPSSVGLPAGSGAGLPNRNTDGSTATSPKPNGNADELSPQSGSTKPGNGKTGMEDGTGSEGTQK